MIPTKGCVKNYHWGQVGETSHIAQFNLLIQKNLAKHGCQTKTKANIDNCNNDSNNNLSTNNNDLPLAELWFGSHPSGPSTLLVGDNMIKLDEFLKREPEMVGVIDLYHKYNKQLPFLFKILSIAKPLSLQAHPDKILAQKLHRNDPKNYPDANHKPELAIALTDFHVLCDFRPYLDIVRFMTELLPLRQLIGLEQCSRYIETQHDSTLGNCFKSLMMAQKDVVARETKALLSNCTNTIDKDLYNLVSELATLYPGDPAIFAPFFLNYLKLKPGQAIYLKANKLHAYIKGECIECMACSDNVVRAGLTTKFRDLQTLINMLNYQPVSSSQDMIFSPSIKQHDDCTLALFNPTEEFQVEKIVIKDKQEFRLPSVKSGSFVIVLAGKASTKDFFDQKRTHKLCYGFAGFVPPRVQIRLFDIQDTLQLYRAFC